MAQNIELKLRVMELSPIEALAQKLCGQTSPTVLRQKDIYYRVNKGRLKLRLINGKSAELISYFRTNSPTARASNYSVIPIRYPRIRDRQLRQQFGRRTIVEKKRLLYMYKNTRIHLDSVKRLGSFVEFEYVVSEQFPPEKGKDVLHFLIQKLGMENAIPCEGSYVDLMEGKN